MRDSGRSLSPAFTREREMNPFPIIIASAIGLFASAVTASANIILNGSFEAPTVPTGNFTNFPVGSALLTDWSVFGPPGTVVSIVSGTFSQNGVSFPAEDG